MSAEARIDVVRRAFTRFAAGDMDGVLELTHPEIIFVPLAAEVTGEPYFGHAGMRAWLSDRQSVWEGLEVVADGFETEGKRLLAAGHIAIRGRSAGVEVDTPVWWVVDVRDGLVSRIEAFSSHGDALAAARA